jgi:hypothetical protein
LASVRVLHSSLTAGDAHRQEQLVVSADLDRVSETSEQRQTQPPQPEAPLRSPLKPLLWLLLGFLAMIALGAFRD